LGASVVPANVKLEGALLEGLSPYSAPEIRMLPLGSMTTASNALALPLAISAQRTLPLGSSFATKALPWPSVAVSVVAPMVAAPVICPTTTTPDGSDAIAMTSEPSPAEKACAQANVSGTPASPSGSAPPSSLPKAASSSEKGPESMPPRDEPPLPPLVQPARRGNATTRT